MIEDRAFSSVANRLLEELGGHRIPEAVLQRDYVLSRILSTMAVHPISTSLRFKGGTALRKCYFANYRFSEDLDFTWTGAGDLGAIGEPLT